MMVDQVSFDIGKSAAELLLIQIGMGCDKGRPVVSAGKTRLIVREST
ncbi:hypothetical protein [Desulfopila sp. IMCC35008]|nr:hypothetical protein [Desulfopila sp. IMCC35008]